MKTLAIDPGYGRLGIAVVEKTGNQKEVLVFSECFETSSKEEHGLRLSKIQKRIEELIKEHKPECLSIETLFFNSNQKTAFLVAEARGIIIGTAVSNGLSVYEYSPPQIKLSVTGDGRSDKTAIEKMIPMLIKIEKSIKHDDEFDAIAVGLTFFAHYKPGVYN